MYMIEETIPLNVPTERPKIIGCDSRFQSDIEQDIIRLLSLPSRTKGKRQRRYASSCTVIWGCLQSVFFNNNYIFLFVCYFIHHGNSRLKYRFSLTCRLLCLYGFLQVLRKVSSSSSAIGTSRVNLVMHHHVPWFKGVLRQSSLIIATFPFSFFILYIMASQDLKYRLQYN